MTCEDGLCSCPGGTKECDGRCIDASGSCSFLLAGAGAAPPGTVFLDGGGVDPNKPFDRGTASLIRSKPDSTLVLASMPDGTGDLYVDDNIRVIVTPVGGSPADQYYEFWMGYPCPPTSMTMPPGGNGAGWSHPIDVSFLFSTDTTRSQAVDLEFWHCATHDPVPHAAFYLVER
jgi:hypothetical protein